MCCIRIFPKHLMLSNQCPLRKKWESAAKKTTLHKKIIFETEQEETQKSNLTFNKGTMNFDSDSLQKLI